MEKNRAWRTEFLEKNRACLKNWILAKFQALERKFCIKNWKMLKWVLGNCWESVKRGCKGPHVPVPLFKVSTPRGFCLLSWSPELSRVTPNVDAFSGVLRGLFCYGHGKPVPGATRMARGGIRLVHGSQKSTLITYYSGMKKDPKYAFLHAFFLICLSCSFQNLSLWYIDLRENQRGNG